MAEPLDAFERLRKQVIDELLRLPQSARFRMTSRTGKPYIPPKRWAYLDLERIISSTLGRALEQSAALDPTRLAQQVALQLPRNTSAQQLAD